MSIDNYISKCEDILNSKSVDFTKLYKIAVRKKVDKGKIANFPENFGVEYYYKLVQMIVDELDDAELSELLNNAKFDHDHGYTMDIKFSNKHLHIVQPEYELFNLVELYNDTITIDCDKLPDAFFLLADITKCVININEGCTSIGDHAFIFRTAKNVQINLPSSLEYFGNIDSKPDVLQEVEFTYAGTIEEFKKIEKFDEKAIYKYTIQCTDGILEGV